MAEERTSVLVVGGALTGLSSAVFLAWHGVPCLVVERHPGLLIHPRLRGITPRTVEVYRQVGLEPAIRAASFAGDGDYRWVTARAETLASPEYAPTEEEGEGEDEGAGVASPCGSAPIDQDKLEVLLRARAEELGAQVRFSTPATVPTRTCWRASPTSGSPSWSAPPPACPTWRSGSTRRSPAPT